MKRFAIILISLLAAYATVGAQSYDSSRKNKIKEKLRSYQSDASVSQLNEILVMFDKGQIPDSRVLAKTYAYGIVYVLSDKNDRSDKGIYTQPAINAALFQCGDKKMGVLQMLPADNSNIKRPLSTYVQQYLKGNATNDTYTSKYMMEYQGMKVNVQPYINNGDEFILAEEGDTYIRQYGNDILVISTTPDYSEVLIYRFKIPYTTTAAVLEYNDSHCIVSEKKTRYPFMREYIVENRSFGDESSADPSRDLNSSRGSRAELVNNSEYKIELSNMIEQIIEDKIVTKYLDTNYIYIVSSGLFQQNLSVKYRGENTHIQSTPTRGRMNYIQFISSNYDGGKDHDTVFDINIPCSNVSLRATFQHGYNSWKLENVQISSISSKL